MAWLVWDGMDYFFFLILRKFIFVEFHFVWKLCAKLFVLPHEESVRASIVKLYWKVNL